MRIFTTYFLPLIAIYLADVSNWLWLTAFMWFVTISLGEAIAFHRYWSHRTFEFKHWIIRDLFTFFGAIGGVGGPIRWVSTHRLHHKDAETIGETHKWLITESAGKRVYRDTITPFNKILHKYYYEFLYLWLLILLLIDYNIFLYGGILPIAVHISLNLIFPNLDHVIGTKRYPNSVGRNSHIVNFFTFGEGWHNNHHNNPGKISNSEAWYEIDISGFIVKLVKSN
jgi:stearoyl-CoA desaturase (delta-9 desaturase)